MRFCVTEGDVVLRVVLSVAFRDLSISDLAPSRSRCMFKAGDREAKIRQR